MAKRIAQSTLNASTIDIINVIRQNASLEYQSRVPVVTQAEDIPKVGEIIYGTPAFSNQFINALVNRIALVRVNSATFNNPYARLKKGMLEFGETVEEIFVNIAKVREFSAEKAESREFKRTLPDVRSAFHVMNWNVQYPVTIQDEDLRLAFLSMEGVQNLIAKIVDSVYTAAEYDDYLLFKYLLIKGIASGQFAPVGVDTSDAKNSAVAFRGTSNKMTFMRKEYNMEGVLTNTPKNRQCIFMSAEYNATFDVNVLASAFNMDKADFMGSLFLIDDWTSFDNDRFDIIRANSTGIEEVTDADLAIMNDVVAVIVDENWFQIYDNLRRFTENYIGSGMYWNYFYNVRETISYSPFSNAVAFFNSSASTGAPTAFDLIITENTTDNDNILVSIVRDPASAFALGSGRFTFVQTEQATENGIAIQPYGGLIIPADTELATLTLDVVLSGTDIHYTGTLNLGQLEVGTTIRVSQF